MTIIKRTGEKATYDEMKIAEALCKAFVEIDKEVSTEDEIIIKKTQALTGLGIADLRKPGCPGRKQWCTQMAETEIKS